MIRTVASIAALAALAGCDNPACVFGGDCSGGGGPGGALGTLSAVAPENGHILKSAAPRILRALPNAQNVDPASPIAIVFSESMSAATFGFAFQLEQEGLGAIPLQANALLGDGRLLVLFPLQDLTLGASYTVRFRENATVGDRLGQELVQPTDGVVTTFTVADAVPDAPRVLMTYPDDSETGLPATSEIAVVFSRPMDAATVDDASFQVEVEGDPPEFDPPAQAVTLGGLATDTRVFRWVSRDGDGERAELGLAADVTVRLSPPEARIEDEDGVALPLKTFSFRTLPFSAPTGARITSIPDDAIGIDQIHGPADLAVRVDVAGAHDGDRLGVFVFGVQPEDVKAPLTLALFREVVIEGTPASFTFTAFDLDLVKSVNPLQARLRDGTLAFAFRVQRGALESAVRLLDVDPAADGAQGPLLDTVRPRLVGLGPSGTNLTSFVTDVRDAVLVGRADEPVRGALVTTILGDNELRENQVPPVVGADDTTFLFVAAPVRVGVLAPEDQPLSYSIRLYDRALNASGTANGTLRQRGVASGGFPRPFAAVTVEVFDAGTLAPVAGASVYVHEQLDGDVFEVGGPFPTLSNGTVVVPPALIGSTIVTVRANGYDLFTFDGVPTDRVCIPLRPTGAGTATLTGTATSLDPSINAYTRRVADTRFLEPGAALAGVNSCSLDTTDQRFECSFGPLPVQARAIGALSAFAFLVPPSVLLWTPPTFLKGFGLSLPLAPVAPGAAQAPAPLVAIDRLDSPTLPTEELPLDVTPHLLTTADFPQASGDPEVTVEAIVPGLHGPLTVGVGAAFSEGLPPGTWAVRAAIPGVADPTADGGADEVGELVARGTIEPDQYLRVEAASAAGARVADRKLLSGTDSMLALPAEPVLGAVPLAPNAAGFALDLAFVDVLPDALAQGGIHRATLTNPSGRRWTIWKLDPPDASGPEVVAHLPLLDGSYPLGGTSADVRISSWSYAAFDSASFLWTDVERLAERSAHSAVADDVAVP